MSKRKIKIIILETLLLFGVLILFYPDISNYFNNVSQSRAILKHSESLERFSKYELEKIFLEAEEYNEKIADVEHSLYHPDRVQGYEETLNPFNNGMMASIIIEKIDVELPIYHGMDEGVIQKNVGHLKGSSLPIGGETTHCVISTHRGLPSAKLFTDLNKLELGDEFTISVLDKELTYKIDQILTVLPSEVEELRIQENKDYMTLFTCTPYGINSHRILVRGERIDSESDGKDKSEKEKEEKSKIGYRIKMIAILVVILLILAKLIRSIVILFKIKKTEQKNL